MTYPQLVMYSTEAEYRNHYHREYCAGPLTTFDGISVRFRKDKFDHVFFESTRRNKTKDRFSERRAQRIDWIKAILQDPDADVKAGWDHLKKRYDHGRRVAFISAGYVAVISLVGPKDADFVTAYLDQDQFVGGGGLSTIDKIKLAPDWVCPWP